MRVDIRLPIGGMFTQIGLLLAIFGLATNGDAEVYARSLNINVNLWWGGAMLIFGLVMLGLGWRAKPLEKKAGN